MMTNSPLSVGSIQRICEGRVSPTEPLWLQVIQVRMVGGHSDSTRFKLILSDSVHTVQSIVGVNLYALLDAKQIDANSLIQVVSHGIQALRGHWILKIFEVNPNSLTRMTGKIGDPQSIELACPVLTDASKPTSSQLHPADADMYRPAVPPLYAASSSINGQQFGGSSMSAYAAQASYQQPAYPTGYNQPRPGGFTGNSNPSSGSQPLYGNQAQSYGGQPASNQFQAPQATKSAASTPAVANSSPVATTSYGQTRFNRPPQPAAPAGASSVSKQPKQPLGRSPIKPVKTAMTSSTGPVVMPISALSPYTEAWTIKARCTQKSDVRTWTNAKGEGRLFSCTLIDSTGEIRLTGFNEQVDQFCELLVTGHVYLLSNAQVKPSKRAFNTTKNDYEIHLTAHSILEHVEDMSDKDVPAAHYDFVPIKSIAETEKDATIDVVGIVREAGDLTSIMTRTKQQPLAKRDLVIADDSLHSIRLTLWAQRAEEYDTSMSSPVIVVKGARVSDYGGRSLSCTAGGNVIYNSPDIRQVMSLKAWYEKSGRQATFTPFSSQMASSDYRDDRKTLAQMLAECTGSGDKSDYATVTATVTLLRESAALYYCACVTEGCNKKVVEEGPSLFRCERCDVSHERCDYRYSFQVQITDETASAWVSIFNETGVTIVGRPAEEVHHMRINNDAEFNALVVSLKGRAYTFKLRARQDTYNGETRVKYNVLSALPVDPRKENETLMSEVERMIME